VSRDPVRVGLVGAGRIAEIAHVPSLEALAGATLAGIADPSSDRRSFFAAAAPHVPAFASAEELVERCELDALVVCSPPPLHHEHALLAREAGLHLYLEKPVAASLEDARQIAERWEGSDRVAMVGFNYRFDAGARELRRRVASGEIGSVIAAQTVFAVPMGQDAGWRAAPGEGGGALFDLGSHHFDLVPFALGSPVASVDAASLQSRRFDEDGAVVSYQLVDGTPVQSVFSLSAVEADRTTVFGETGALALDRNARNLSRTPARVEYGRAAALRRTVSECVVAVRGLVAGHGVSSHRAALEAFVAATRGDDVEGPTLEDGIRSLEVVHAARAAARDDDREPVPPTPEPGT
jgi:myo-inositol 2-dehydrogenase/D-chiro-inositol 1-dehydrogenase